MFVCGLPFLITLSWLIRFVTVKYVPHRTASKLANALINVYKIYSCARFVCQTALMDGEFDKVKDKLLDRMIISICTKKKHVPEIEHKIHQGEILMHQGQHQYAMLPNIVIKQMVLHAVMFINSYPDEQGIC